MVSAMIPANPGQALQLFENRDRQLASVGEFIRMLRLGGQIQVRFAPEQNGSRAGFGG